MPYGLDGSLANADGLNPQIIEILDLLSRVAKRLEPEAEDTKAWMAQHFQNPQIAQLLPELTLTMLRVLDAIGRLEPVNGISISKQSRVPKGSVSKITRRLIAKKLVDKESLPNNKKEILFRLTPLGREVFHAHRAFDTQMEQGVVQFLQRYESGELAFMVQVLQDVLDASFLE